MRTNRISTPHSNASVNLFAFFIFHMKIERI